MGPCQSRHRRKMKMRPPPHEHSSSEQPTELPDPNTLETKIPMLEGLTYQSRPIVREEAETESLRAYREKYLELGVSEGNFKNRDESQYTRLRESFEELCKSQPAQAPSAG